MENKREELGKCPECGKPVYEGKKSYYCSGYKEEIGRASCRERV